MNFSRLKEERQVEDNNGWLLQSSARILEGAVRV